MITCDNATCKGHLGKFDSCRDEALYDISMECDSTGSTEFEGHFAGPIEITEPELYNEQWLTVTVEPGIYIVETVNSGRVSVYTFDNISDAEDFMKQASNRYCAWEDEII